MDRLQGSPEGLWMGTRQAWKKRGLSKRQVAVTLRALELLWAYQVVGCTIARGGLMAVWRWSILLYRPPSHVAPLLYHLRSRAEYWPEKAWVGDHRGCRVLSLCAARRTIRAPLCGISQSKIHQKGRRGSTARCTQKMDIDKGAGNIRSVCCHWKCRLRA